VLNMFIIQVIEIVRSSGVMFVSYLACQWCIIITFTPRNCSLKHHWTSVSPQCRHIIGARVNSFAVGGHRVGARKNLQRKYLYHPRLRHRIPGPLSVPFQNNV